jgi:outer membrane protein assembly factor BamB
LWEFNARPALIDFLPYKFDSPQFCGSPVLSGKIIYIGSSDGHLYALDIDTGQVVWRYDIGSPICSTAAVSGNTVFITTYSGHLYAFVSK